MSSVARRSRRLFLSFSLARFFGEREVRTVVLNDLSSLWLAPIFRLSGLNVVSLLHLRAQRRNTMGFGHTLFELLVLRISVWFAHSVLSVNEENVSFFGPRTRFVGNFVPDWFSAVEVTEPKRFDLGFIGRFAPEKNLSAFLLMVKAFGAQNGGQVRALMVGAGPEEDALLEQIRQMGLSGQVEVRPWEKREKLPEIYDQIRCFAVTSHHEGFPTTLLEAHSRGVPAVVSVEAGFSTRFVTEEEPVTGFSFALGDETEASLTTKIGHLVNNPFDYFDACRAKAERYSADRVLGQITSEILKLH